MNYGKYNPYESGDVEIISEDENLKIVEVLTKDAAFYFGGDLYSQNWADNFMYGDLYFLISSDPDVQVFSIHNRDNNDPSVIRYGYDKNEFTNTDDLKKYFPKSIKVLNPIIRFGKTFEFLKKIYNGYEPRWNENGDKIIGEIKFNSKSPSNSIVVIEFNDDEDFLNIFDLDSDDRYEWRYYMSDYSNVDYDTYRYTEDWDEGDFFQYAFDGQNKEKLINIVRTFFPSTDITDTKKISELAKEIDSDFVGRVVDEYASEWENCIYNNARDEIRSDLENPFVKFGIKQKSLAYKYESTVGVLLTWYKQLKSENDDLGSLLKELIDKFDKNNYRGDWGELRYNGDCPDWNNEGYDAYQTYVSDRLDKIIEKYEEDDRFVNYYEFIELQQQIDQEYGFGKWIPVKTDKNIYFKIDKIDPETNKVIITFKNNQSDNREEQRSVDYDELKRIETQYELFEEIKKIVGRLK